jgi:hypothetical protein
MDEFLVHFKIYILDGLTKYRMAIGNIDLIGTIAKVFIIDSPIRFEW